MDFCTALLLSLLFHISSALQIPLVQHDASPLDEKFNDLVRRTMDSWHVPGLSIAVVDGDDTYSQVLNFSIGLCLS